MAITSPLHVYNQDAYECLNVDLRSNFKEKMMHHVIHLPTFIVLALRALLSMHIRMYCPFSSQGRLVMIMDWREKGKGAMVLVLTSKERKV